MYASFERIETHKFNLLSLIINCSVQVHGISIWSLTRSSASKSCITALLDVVFFQVILGHSLFDYNDHAF